VAGLCQDLIVPSLYCKHSTPSACNSVHIHSIANLGESVVSAYFAITRPILTPQIPFCIYDKTFSASERLFKERIAARERYAVVPAFDYEVNG
jgi:hypothetical protein